MWAGAFHSLQRLGQSCELVVVTSRQHCIQAPTLAWVEQHFPGVFSEVHFGNHWALEGQSKAKSEICRCADLPPARPGGEPAPEGSEKILPGGRTFMAARPALFLP